MLARPSDHLSLRAALMTTPLTTVQLLPLPCAQAGCGFANVGVRIDDITDIYHDQHLSQLQSATPRSQG